jgi:DNA-directed RNA polymerase subunit E"
MIHMTKSKPLQIQKNPGYRPTLFLPIQQKTRNKNCGLINIILAKEFACKKCKALTMGKMCPVCKSTELSKDWSGILLIFDHQKSKIASTLEITDSHKYALKVT